MLEKGQGILGATAPIKSTTLQKILAEVYIRITKEQIYISASFSRGRNCCRISASYVCLIQITFDEMG
jgi:hypothetical protein